jgi:imidazolonepropionase-like amidohydrolase
VRLMADNRIVWVPTVIHNLLIDVVKEDPARLDDQQLEADLPPDLYEDVRESFRFPSRLGYFYDDSEEDRSYASKVRQLYDAGVQIVVGTDSGTPMNFHYESTWQEMDLLVQYGIPPLEVIGMATRQPALLYGAYDDIGSLEPGKLADIIVVNGNPLRRMSALQQNNVIYVIKGGVQYKGPDQP